MVLSQSPAWILKPTAHSLVLSQPHSLFRTPDLLTCHLCLDIHRPLGLNVSHIYWPPHPLPSTALHLVLSPRVPPVPTLECGSQPTSFSFSPTNNLSVSSVGSTPECLVNPPLLLAPFLGQALVAATAQNWSSCLQSGLLQNSQGTLP